MSRFISDKRKVVCLIIIVCIVFLSLLGILFVGRTTAGHTACIYSNGRLIRTVELDSESEQTFTVYSDDGGYNVIKVSGGTISVSDADCPDKICVKTAPLSDRIQPIVCMPHKLVIRVEARRGEYSASCGNVAYAVYCRRYDTSGCRNTGLQDRSCVLPCSFLAVSRRSVESIRYRTDTDCTDTVVGACIGQYYGFAVFSVRRYAVVCRNGGHAPLYKRSVGSIPCRHILGCDA